MSVTQNLRVSFQKSNLAQQKDYQVSAKTEHTSSDNNVLFEKNENETDKSLHIQSFLLPFSLSCYQSFLSQPDPGALSPIAKKRASPIYLEVCHFNIWSDQALRLSVAPAGYTLAWVTCLFF